MFLCLVSLLPRCERHNLFKFSSLMDGELNENDSEDSDDSDDSDQSSDIPNGDLPDESSI